MPDIPLVLIAEDQPQLHTALEFGVQRGSGLSRRGVDLVARDSQNQSAKNNDMKTERHIRAFFKRVYGLFRGGIYLARSLTVAARSGAVHQMAKCSKKPFKPGCILKQIKEALELTDPVITMQP